MLLILALASAAFYGAADFLGGLASRRSSTISVVVVAQLSGLVALGLMLPVLPPSTPGHDDWIWGAAAGITGGIGVALLYRALAMGSMAIIAPITAVCAVIVPVAASIAFGERPGTGAVAGIALAIVAIVLVSQQSRTVAPRRRGGTAAETRGAGTALASGVAIGLFFLTLAQANADAGMWPLVTARAVSSVLFAILALVARRSMRMPQQVVTIAVAGGLLDILANVLYLLATRHGPLSMVVTLSSLYPASTVLLARVVLGERLSRVQTAGVACALAAVVLIVGTR
jgi:drug/metabolite transporter (DMT)-like permease